MVIYKSIWISDGIQNGIQMLHHAQKCYPLWTPNIWKLDQLSDAIQKPESYSDVSGDWVSSFWITTVIFFCSKKSFWLVFDSKATLDKCFKTICIALCLCICFGVVNAEIGLSFEHEFCSLSFKLSELP